MTAEEIRDIVQRVLDQAKRQEHCEVVEDGADTCVIGINGSVFVGDLLRISHEIHDPHILVDEAINSENNIELYIQK